MKEQYPHIKRVYVRAEHCVIGEDYKAYLLTMYEQTYFPERVIGAGRAAYVERNFEMIDKSGFCMIYYDEPNKPTARKSGSKTAYRYAVKKKKEIILFPEQ